MSDTTNPRNLRTEIVLGFAWNCFQISGTWRDPTGIHPICSGKYCIADADSRSCLIGQTAELSEPRPKETEVNASRGGRDSLAQ
jgi:hypothetical protein